MVHWLIGHSSWRDSLGQTRFEQYPPFTFTDIKATVTPPPLTLRPIHNRVMEAIPQRMTSKANMVIPRGNMGSKPPRASTPPLPLDNMLSSHSTVSLSMGSHTLTRSNTRSSSRT